MMTEDYTLEDLEKISGMSIRTLRFYIQEGLLPGPDTRGKFARYSQTHLDTIRFIDRLKDLNMPLKQIRHLLETMSSEDIEQIIESQSEQITTLMSPQFFSKNEYGKDESDQEERSSALEYIRSLENLQDSLKINENNTRFYSAPVPSQASLKKVYMSQSLKSGESWKRFQLTEGVELQIRQPIDREKENIVEELIETARQLFAKSKNKGETK